MSGLSYEAWQQTTKHSDGTNTVTVNVMQFGRASLKRATEAAEATLKPGERLGQLERTGSMFRWQVIGATTLTRAEIANGTGFGKGARFVQVAW